MKHKFMLKDNTEFAMLPSRIISFVLVILYSFMFLERKVIFPMFIATAIRIFDLIFIERTTVSYLEKSVAIGDERRALVKTLKLPLRKIADTFIHYIGCGLIASFIFYFFFNFSFGELGYFFSVWVLSSFFPSLISFLVYEKKCYPRAEKIIEKNISNPGFFAPFDFKTKKYLGVSLSTVFILFIVVPVCFAVLMSFIFIMSLEKIDGNKIWKTVFLELLNFSTISYCAYLFFNQLSINSNKIQEALLALEKNDAEDDTLLFDLSTEISYAAYKVRQIISLFDEITDKTEKTTLEINENSSELSETVSTLGESIVREDECITEVISTLKEAYTLSSSLEERIEETHTVAEKTNEHINFGLEALKQNLAKMKEIISANENSINGIQTLSNKISSIWEIASLINSIADQTKIIAFNAELEAENISEGKDKFKNVAFNIRELTDQVIDLTKQIRSQIQSIQNSADDLIAQGNEGTQIILKGNKQTECMEEKLSEIQKVAKESAASTVEIKTAMQMQNKAIGEILENLEKVNSKLGVVRTSISNGKEKIISIIDASAQKLGGME